MTDVQKLDMGESEPQMSTNWPALANVPQQVLKVKRLHPDAALPTYATEGSACFDLHAIGLQSDYDKFYYPLRGGGSVAISTGLAFEVPPGHVLLIFSRSGHGFSFDTRLANCVGVIDSDYRGHVRVKLTRDAEGFPLELHNGDRIAQAMLVPIPRVQLVEVEELSSTDRGEGGFGSTGK